MAVARALLALGAAHTRVGDHRAAATTTQEAVGLYRELADLNRDAHLPALAMAVGNLATRLGDATRLADALRAAQEAAQLYRLARQIHGDVYADDMSDAVRLVNSLTDTVGEVDGGRPSDP